jgi:PAS domain S-box-containing protein
MDSKKDIYNLSYFTIKQSNQSILWLDTKGNILHFNDATCRLSGYTPDELKGKKIYDLHPDENEETWQELWSKLKQVKRHTFEKWQPIKNSKQLRIKVSQNLIEIDNELFIVSLIEDKTSEYNIKSKVQEEERKLATLMSNLPGMAYRCINDSNYTMEFVSSGCEKLTGYTPEELTFNKMIAYNNIVVEDDRGRVRNEIEDKIRHGKHFEIKYRIQKSTGEIRWVWERGITVSHGKGHPEIIEGFITDITDIKNAEQALIEKEESLRKLKDQLKEETIYLREEIKLTSNFEDIISTSESFKTVLYDVEKVAPTDSTVLITGETGTGKELIARALHNNSNRSKRSLVTVNCAALPSEMIESELFGHEKGAFTGAYERKIGRFEYAHEGTIFLDEIGELPLSLQTKLLRVLQEGEFQRLGNSKTTNVDVRIIAATNRNLKKAVEKGEFRGDLYYRLNVFPIHIPPLRERKEDIPLLVNHFIKKYGKKTGKYVNQTSKKVMDRLLQYDWPGNIRELENIIERAVILSENGRIKPGAWIPGKNEASGTNINTLEENERKHILKALNQTKWRVGGENGAARLLGIKRTTLQARMKKLNIVKPE